MQSEARKLWISKRSLVRNFLLIVLILIFVNFQSEEGPSVEIGFEALKFQVFRVFSRGKLSENCNSQQKKRGFYDFLMNFGLKIRKFFCSTRFSPKKPLKLKFSNICSPSPEPSCWASVFGGIFPQNFAKKFLFLIFFSNYPPKNQKIRFFQKFISQEESGAMKECELCCEMVPAGAFCQLINCRHVYCRICIRKVEKLPENSNFLDIFGIFQYMELSILGNRVEIPCPGGCPAVIHPNDVTWVL